MEGQNNMATNSIVILYLMLLIFIFLNNKQLYSLTALLKPKLYLCACELYLMQSGKETS